MPSIFDPLETPDAEPFRRTELPPPGEAGPPPPRLAYSIQETAQMLGVCTKTVRRLITRGLLRPSRALRHLLIPKTEIDRFLKETL